MKKKTLLPIAGRTESLDPSVQSVSVLFEGPDEAFEDLSLLLQTVSKIQRVRSGDLMAELRYIGQKRLPKHIGVIGIEFEADHGLLLHFSSRDLADRPILCARIRQVPVPKANSDDR